MSGVWFCINIFVLFCFLFSFFALFNYSLNTKDQSLQVIKHADQTSLPAETASASHKRGSVITIMTAVMAQMNNSVVSILTCVWFFCFVLRCFQFGQKSRFEFRNILCSCVPLIAPTSIIQSVILTTSISHVSTWMETRISTSGTSFPWSRNMLFACQKFKIGCLIHVGLCAQKVIREHSFG